MISYSFYSGAGNLFVLIDNRQRTLDPRKELIEALCSHVSPQADGVILVESSSLADAKMRIFNRDGSEAAMCGNGLRTFIKFLEELGIKKDEYHIETLASSYMGLHGAKILNDQVKIEMGKPHSIEWNLSLEGESPLHFLNTGVPHAICFVEDLSALDVEMRGSKVRHHPYFSPQGTNVTFTQILTPHSIAIRTFERGVEGETLACGTGATAAAFASLTLHGIQPPVTVRLHSGEKMIVSFSETGEGLTLLGPAKKIGSGSFIN